MSPCLPSAWLEYHRNEVLVDTRPYFSNKQAGYFRSQEETRSIAGEKKRACSKKSREL